MEGRGMGQFLFVDMLLDANTKSLVSKSCSLACVYCYINTGLTW